GVCAIVGDGRSLQFHEAVYRIKGERRRGRPMATMLSTERFVKLLRREALPPSLMCLIDEPRRFPLATSGLCPVPGPLSIAASRQAPSPLVSVTSGEMVMQNWDACGHPYAERLIGELIKHGIDYPAGTSMNESGEPEIVDEDDGIAFSR